MEILTTSSNCITDKYGYYTALVRERGKRKVYECAMEVSSNSLLSIIKEYPNKKTAFAALNIQ